MALDLRPSALIPSMRPFCPTRRPRGHGTHLDPLLRDPMGLLERAVSYKDKIAQGLSPNHGLFAYPVLQAADILIYLSDLVPVGRIRSSIRNDP